MAVPSVPIEDGSGKAYGQSGPTSTPTPTETPVPFTPTPTATPTNTPVSLTPTPTAVPTAPPAVSLNVTTAIPGQALVAAGTVPDTALTYSLCLLSNGTFTIGSPFAGSCVLQQSFTTPTSVFSGVALGPAPAPGNYDLLLLGPGGTIEAADDAAAAAGLVVAGATEIPAGGRAGLFGFALLVAAGAWVLLRQFR